MTEQLRGFFGRPKRVLWALIANYVACSMLFSLLERKPDGSHYGPISGLWWGIVTLSTTGYGDYSPVTTAGRGVAAWLMVFSGVLVVIAYAHATGHFLPDPNTFTDAEQRVLLRQSAETNFLVRELIKDSYGEPMLEQSLRRFDETYDPDAGQPKETDNA